MPSHETDRTKQAQPQDLEKFTMPASAARLEMLEGATVEIRGLTGRAWNEPTEIRGKIAQVVSGENAVALVLTDVSEFRRVKGGPIPGSPEGSRYDWVAKDPASRLLLINNEFGNIEVLRAPEK